MSQGVSRRPAAVIAVLLFMLAISLLSGCGGETIRNGSEAVTEAATAFLNALGDRRVDGLRSFMSQEYLDTNAVPDPISVEQLLVSLGYLSSYRFIPEEDVIVEGERAVISVDVQIADGTAREETLVMVLSGGEWKVDAFTAIDWSKRPADTDDETTEAEQVLYDFLVACIDGDTEFIFSHLSPAYREKHRLDDPWTRAEFSGIFGTARSFDFDSEGLEPEGDVLEVDVTVEFGSRGNLESETARVVMVREGGEWLVDAFPFFIY